MHPTHIISYHTERGRERKREEDRGRERKREEERGRERKNLESRLVKALNFLCLASYCHNNSCFQCVDCSWSSTDSVGISKAGIYELLQRRHFNGDKIVLQNIHSIKVDPPPLQEI